MQSTTYANFLSTLSAMLDRFVTKQDGERDKAAERALSALTEDLPPAVKTLTETGAHVCKARAETWGDARDMVLEVLSNAPQWVALPPSGVPIIQPMPPMPPQPGLDARGQPYPWAPVQAGGVFDVMSQTAKVSQAFICFLPSGEYVKATSRDALDLELTRVLSRNNHG